MTALAAAEPVLIGPPGVPQFTLGWNILEWSGQYLTQPDGYRAGEPWVFTDEQARFVLWWYALDPQGRFLYRSGMLRRMKGWGKDPVGAAICAAEFVGPCRFAGWDADHAARGEPVQTSWVQVAAVSKEQTRGTMQLFPGMFSRRAIEQYRIDLGKEIIYAYGGRCQIQAVTSSPHTLEGARSTFCLKNETHWWAANNDGHAMAAVIARNAAKVGGRVLAISNAHNPGEDSDAERDHDMYLRMLAGTTRGTGFLYSSREAPAGTDLTDRAALTAGLLAARGDSAWLDVERLADEVYDPRNPASQSRRFYLNQVVAGEDAWIAPLEWDAAEDGAYRVAPGAIITLGFDGSKTDDHTALVGCEVETGYLFTLGVWNPADEPGQEIDRGKVNAAVAGAFAAYDVVGFYSDRNPWESYIDKWAEMYGEQLCVAAKARQPVEWDMGARLNDVTKASEAFKAALLDGDMKHERSDTSRWYVLNARARVNNYGTTFSKESRNSARKIDWLAAAVLARLARQDYMALPESKQRNSYAGVSFV